LIGIVSARLNHTE
jgi:hypothetical protein